MQRAHANRQFDLHVVIEEVQKDVNVSSVVRTAESVGVAKVHVITTDGAEQVIAPHASKGAERWLEFESYAEPGTCIARLKSEGIAVYCSALTDGAVDFRSVDYTIPCAIAVGNEANGASGSLEALADECVLIPMMGLSQSLNVNAAAAVLLYEAQRQRADAGMYATDGLCVDAPSDGRSAR